MRLILALLVALTTWAATQTAAVAGSFKDWDGNLYTIDEPSYRWLAMPGPKPVVRALPRFFAVERCRLVTGKADTFGCAKVGPNSCEITIIDELPAQFRAAVLKHELAHCNGWGADHGKHPLDP